MYTEILQTYANPILLAILCAIFGALGLLARHALSGILTDDAKRAAARTAAQFVEQVFHTLHGPEKLQRALETAETLLRKKGIPFDAAEMQILIEAAVSEFNKSFYQKRMSS